MQTSDVPVEVNPFNPEIQAAFEPSSVEAQWETTGATLINSIGANLLARGEEQRVSYTNNVLRDMHVLMNGRVNEIGSSVATKRKVIEMIRLGLEEDLTDPVTQEVYAWYLDTKDKKSPGFDEATNGERLDRTLLEMAETSGDSAYLSLRESEARESPLFMQARLASFLAFNSLDLFYRDTSIFTRVAIQGATKFEDRFQKVANTAEQERQGFVNKVKAKGLNVYLDVENAEAIMRKLDIEVHDPGSGVIKHLGVQETARLKGEANGRTGKVRILEAVTHPDDRLTGHSANHEFVHMVSRKNFLQDGKSISMGFHYAPKVTEGFSGRIFNEGMTESVTESLLDDPMGIYPHEVKIMNVIFGADEAAWDKALHLFFNGQHDLGEEIPIVALIDSILGPGAARKIDGIDQQQGAKAALKYAKQLQKQRLSHV